MSFNNTGDINVLAGTLALPNSLTNGPGTLHVAPGARMNVGGTFTNSAQGTVRVGLLNATTTGLVAVTGGATLAGTLAVYLDGGFVLAESDLFTRRSRARNLKWPLAEAA